MRKQDKGNTKIYSIIVPVLNGENTIKECIGSLLKQSTPRNRYEIIVVDDGSTDDTRSIVNNFSVRYFRQQNQGPAAARNLGAKKAVGDIILFTDSDCVVAKNWIEEIVRPILEKREIVGVKGAYKTLQKEIIARFVQLEYEDRYGFMKKNKYIDFIDTYSAAYKRDVFISSGGFDTTFCTAMSEDTELSYRLAKSGYKMIFNPNAIVYHYHPTSLRKYIKRKFKAAFWRILVYRKHPNKISKDTHTPHSIKLQIVSIVIILLWGFLGLIFAKWLLGLILIGLSTTLLSFLPPIIKALKKDPVVGLISPVLITLRDFAYIIGLIAGILKSVRRKGTVFPNKAEA